MALHMNPNYPILRHVLWAPEGIYLVPRRDGRLLIGATVEERVSTPTLPPQAGYCIYCVRLVRFAGIDELPVIETWVGFRPTSRDDAPILGPTAIEGLIVATGHHRNGIFTPTPLTANAVSHYILTRELTDGIEPFTAPLR